MTNDELAHYGVLGMKWGHRKTATTADIHSAHKRIGIKQQKYAVAAGVRDKTTKRGSAERKKADAKLSGMAKDFWKDPDRVVASRMTRGEKAAALIIAGPIGLAPIAASSAISRRIEKAQDDGFYDKKK